MPPMPALIPIAALRQKTASPAVGASPQCAPCGENNNGPPKEECRPCFARKRNRHRHYLAHDGRCGHRGSQKSEVGHENRTEATAVLTDDGDEEEDDEVRLSASSGAEDGDMDGEMEETGEGLSLAHGDTQRSRRLSRKPSATTIDAMVSRDRADAGQAPSRRTRPERHRKSDRRRRGHRSATARRRSTSASSANTTTTTATSITTGTICTDTDTEPTADCSERRRESTEEEVKRPSPRVNPIFVWTRQEDNRIVEVRCEDYDKRNRIVLTKTRRGWRAFPRTENNDIGTHEEESDSERPHAHHSTKHHHEHRHERHKNGPGRPRGRRKSRLGKKSRGHRKRHTDKHVEQEDEPEINEQGPEPYSDPEPPTSPGSPVWGNPVNIESHLPSHTIAIRRRKSASPSPTRSSSPETIQEEIQDSPEEVEITEVKDSDDEDDDIEETVDSACVNSAVAQAPQCRVPSDVSPLDNLLAVAELEFNHEVRRESVHEKAEDVYSQHEDGYDASIQSVSQSEVVQCADVTGGLEKHSYEEKSVIVSTSSVTQESQDCDYNEEDDDDENHMSDVLERLEQSLQSPIEEGEQEHGHEHNQEHEQEQEQDLEEEQDIGENDGEVNENFNDEKQDNEYDEEDELLENEQITEQEIQKDIQEPEDESDEMHLETQEISEPKELQDTEIEEAEEEVERDVAAAETEEEDEENVVRESDIAEQDYDSVTEKSQDADAQLDALEQPTDLSVMDAAIDDDLLPTDLSTHSKKADEVPPPSEIILDDMQPTDLSIRKHSSPSLSIEPPPIRPPSQNSETIQSPQPSGIPAVPPSPDIFPANNKQQNSKSMFLETLLSSASPKLILNSELTITRNQKEPLDLGKGRKSASPTVTCSEEAKQSGEPSPKRLKVEDITLKNLLHAEGKKPEITIKPLPSEPKKPTNTEQSSRLLELLTTDSEPDVLTQLQQLLDDPDFVVPEPMLVPKDKVSCIVDNPAKEIPRLFNSRPELRFQNALDHPTILNDPNIICLTLKKLYALLYKKVHSGLDTHEIVKAITQDKTKPEQSEKSEKPKSTSKSNTKPQNNGSTNESSSVNEYFKYTQQQQQMIEAQLKQHSNEHKNKNTNGLSRDEIDPATTAAFNQMMWLPYLNQLQAAAAAQIGTNPELFKALSNVFPGYPGQPQLSLPEHVPPMFGTDRFGLPNAFPMQTPIDYANQHELAMWQEALLRQKISNSLQENNHSKSSNPYRDNADMRNLASMSNNRNKYGANYSQERQRSHSARTNPVQHNSSYTRHSLHNSLMYGQSTEVRQNLQIPRYDTSMSQAQKSTSQAYLQQRNSIPNPYLMHSSRKEQELRQQQEQMLQQQQLQLQHLQQQRLQQERHQLHQEQQLQQQKLQQKQKQEQERQHKLEQQKLEQQKFEQQKQQEQIAQAHSYNLQKSQSKPPPDLPKPPIPRVQCRPLQTLLSPAVDPIKPQLTPIRTPGEPHKPIDLSASKSSAKQKSKSFMDQYYFGSGLWQRHDEVAEVGSTTEEMTGNQLHETHHVWHPLFGK